MADQSFDLIVLGGGPGGYVAAIRAAQLGMKTALVEREHLGGICLNWGCIPTKALLRSSEINHLLHRLDDFGFSAKDISFDAGKVVARSRAVAKQLSNGVAYLLAQEQGHGLRRPRALGRQGAACGREGRQPGRRARRPAHRAGDRRAGARLAGARARRRAGVDLQGGDGPAGDPQIAAGRRLGRDRDRIRQLLPRHGRRGDGGRSARPRSAGRGRGDLRLRPQILREAGDQDPYRCDSGGAGPQRGWGYARGSKRAAKGSK